MRAHPPIFRRPRNPVLAGEAWLARNREFVKFGTVGASTWVIDTAIFLLLKTTLLEAKPVTAKIIAVVAATLCSYVLNREWSFRNRGGRARPSEISLFFVFSAIGVAIYSAPLWVSRYVLDLRVPLVSTAMQETADFVSAQVIGVAIGMLFRWWGFRRFVFPHRRVAGTRLDDRARERDGTGLAPRSSGPRLSIVLPTRNERENVEECLRRVALALAERYEFEIVVVDDSDDDTANIVARLAESSRLMLLHRPPGERSGGLGGALLAGFAAASGDVVVVMDADLQHPPEVLPDLVDPLVDGRADISVASRYLDGGSATGLDGAHRRASSLLARAVVHLLIPATRSSTDPCGGLFAVDRALLQCTGLAPEGFKILVEVLARTPWESLVEIPYRFEERSGGRSNFGYREVLRFARHLLRLLARGRRRVLTAAPETSPAEV